MTGRREETISVRGRKVRLYHGGAGPCLLFLHDSFCPGWLPLHDRLAANYQVFVPIHPGFAGSEDNFDEFEEMEDLIFHYRDLCEVLQLDRPVVAGASFGGWLAAEWAVRYNDTIKNLILIDALGLRLDETPAVDIFALDATAMRQAVFGDPLGMLAMEIIPETPKADSIVSAILARRTLARFAWQFPDNPRLRRYLDRVRLPTLILWGERDGVVSASHGRAYHQAIANSQYATIPDLGHLPHVEAPELCIEIMCNFLRGP
jgi:pimeloyl-ACP methyl ester carboxylesterase